MSKLHIGDRWRRALPRSLTTRFRQPGPMPSRYLPDTSHIQRGIR